MKKNPIFNEANLPLEVALLLIAGLTMLITGILLFPVSFGEIPYYKNGLYGLLIFIFALQIVTMGKTPFGDMSKSVPLIVIGIIIALIGIITCFVPVDFYKIPNIVLFICFTPGGFFLFLKMFFSRDKLRLWLKYGAVFKHLIFACMIVYLLSMIIGLLVLMHNYFNITITALIVVLFGISIFYLSFVLRIIYLKHPEAENTNSGTVKLSTDKMILLMTGVFMLLLGILLIPVNLGKLPFSGSAQLGLLMVIFSIQMLASGSTPIGPFSRSWLIIGIGLIFASLGIISCVIPEILVKPLTILIGVLNISGGIISLVKTLLPVFNRTSSLNNQIPPVLKKLFFTQLIMGCLSILFGSSMLVSNLLPGLIIGIVLFANGCILLYLIKILLVLTKIKNQMQDKI